MSTIGRRGFMGSILALAIGTIAGPLTVAKTAGDPKLLPIPTGDHVVMTLPSNANAEWEIVITNHEKVRCVQVVMHEGTAMGVIHPGRTARINSLALRESDEE